MKIITRQQAIKEGLKYYFTGVKCKRGHLDKRDTKWRKCKTCGKLAEKKRTGRWATLTEEAKAKIRSQQRRENMTEDQIKRKSESAKRSYLKNRQWNLQRGKNRRSQSGYHKKVYEQRKERIKIDPSFKMRMIMSQHVHRVLSKIGRRKEKSSIDYLGYSAVEFKEHLEKQFTGIMCWDNFGSVWHIDHITPVSAYFKDGITDPAVVNRLSNLQPLLVKDNLSKGSKRIFLI